MARLKSLANDGVTVYVYIELVEKVSHLTAKRWTLERWAKINCRRHLCVRTVHTTMLLSNEIANP